MKECITTAIIAIAIFTPITYSMSTNHELKMKKLEMQAECKKVAE